MSTTGDDGGNSDLHELGEAVIAAVAAEIGREDAERTLQAAATGTTPAERFSPAEAQKHFTASENIDVDEIPDAVWAVLTAGARSAIEAVSGSGEHDRAFNTYVHDDPYGSGERVLSVNCVHTDDSEDGADGVSAPVHFDAIAVYQQDTDALAVVDDLCTTDPLLLQSWWIEALKDSVGDVEVKDVEDVEDAADIVIRSMTTNIFFPFPDATGRIRCPHGVTFEIVDTTERDAAVQKVRDGWDDDRTISDPELLESLENLATGILGETLAEFGDEGLISGISADGEGVTVRMLTDEEREVGLPGIEVVTAPADRRLVGRLERELGRSVTATNAVWSRALESAVDRIAEFSPHPRAAIVRVVERSTVMLAEEELALTA
ncbi:hypothetical protein [Corynebacterium sp.]|uniref:hypothetical protein n=1 Tax=Corynebacterium sp. TaxID=1720 RepID=UPI0028A79860|nr:hypothetical protein [Corynebacterium sp.]